MAWLRNLDASGIQTLMLQPRYSSIPHFTQWGDQGKDVAVELARKKRMYKNFTSGVWKAASFGSDFILHHLPHYQLEWSSPIYNVPNYVYYFFQRQR